jgi:hypothetical protein
VLSGVSVAKRALLVGIDSYSNFPALTGCVADATALSSLLEKNGDGTFNYENRVLVSSGSGSISRSVFMRAWRELFADFSGDVIFYFAGHGKSDEMGGHLCLQDSSWDDPGVCVNDLLLVANHSIAREVLIIIDTCFGFSSGRSPRFRNALIDSPVQLREGITLLGAAQPSSKAKELNGRGVFSGLLTEALAGGGADVRGYVTAASAYSYIDQSLGAWEQRPVFRSNVGSFVPIRRCKESVPDNVFKELVIFFSEKDSKFHLDPSFNHAHESASRKNVQILKKLELCQSARILVTSKGESLFDTALSSEYVELTPLGKLYWRLVTSKRL